MTPDRTPWKVLGPGNCQEVAQLLQPLTGCLVNITHAGRRRQHLRPVPHTETELVKVGSVSWAPDGHEVPTLYVYRAGSQGSAFSYPGDRLVRYRLEFDDAGELAFVHLRRVSARDPSCVVTTTFEILTAYERAA